MEQLDLAPELEALIEAKIKAMQPHKCQTCGWWKRFDVEVASFPVAGNCLYIGTIELDANSQCARWKPA